MKLCGSDTDKHTKTFEALLDWFCFFPSLTSVAFYNFIEAFLIKKKQPHIVFLLAYEFLEHIWLNVIFLSNVAHSFTII